MFLCKELTNVEKTVIESWSKYDPIHDASRPVNIAFFRDMMKRTACHEAAHLVTRMFTGLEASHVQLVSIIPDRKTNGRMRCERPFAERYLQHVPFQLQRSQGYCLLLEYLAGYGATMIMEGPECETLWDYLCDELAIDDEWYEEGTDLYRADRIAGILSRPHFSKDRILGMTGQWTLEMLRIPAIWDAVEAIAAMLISQGEITTAGNDEVFSNIQKDLDVPQAMKIPKWFRRLYGTLSSLTQSL